MNCSPLQLAKEKPRTNYGDPGSLDGIAQIANARSIDLNRLVDAIGAVPGFAGRLCACALASGVEFDSMSDAAVLLGRAGIQAIIDEYLHDASTITSDLNLRLVAQKTSCRDIPAQAHIRLVKL